MVLDLLHTHTHIYIYIYIYNWPQINTHTYICIYIYIYNWPQITTQIQNQFILRRLVCRFQNYFQFCCMAWQCIALYSVHNFVLIEWWEWLVLAKLSKAMSFNSQRIWLISAWCRINASVNWVSIGSRNGLSPVRRQAITRTNTDLLSIRHLGTTFSDIWIEIKKTVTFTKIHLKLSSAKWLPFCSGGWVNMGYRLMFCRIKVPGPPGDHSGNPLALVREWMQVSGFNLLTPGRCNFKNTIFSFIIQNSSLATHCGIFRGWIPKDLINLRSTLVQVMAWSRQVTVH